MYFRAAEPPRRRLLYRIDRRARASDRMPVWRRRPWRRRRGAARRALRRRRFGAAAATRRRRRFGAADAARRRRRRRLGAATAAALRRRLRRRLGATACARRLRRRMVETRRAWGRRRRRRRLAMDFLPAWVERRILRARTTRAADFLRRRFGTPARLARRCLNARVCLMKAPWRRARRPTRRAPAFAARVRRPIFFMCAASAAPASGPRRLRRGFGVALMEWRLRRAAIRRCMRFFHAAWPTSPPCMAPAHGRREGVSLRAGARAALRCAIRAPSEDVACDGLRLRWRRDGFT